MARRGRVRYNPANDYYLILGVNHSATTDEIQNAFRQRAKKLHPDRNPDNEATVQFQRLSEAYAVLSDPASRAEYDTVRETTRPWFGRYDVPGRGNFATARKPPGIRGWIAVLAMLWSGPYRYVLIVLMVVILVNIALSLATNQTSSADPNQSPSTPVSPLDAGGPTPGMPLFSDECGPTDSFLSPTNNALLSNASFTVAVAAQGTFQLDWATVTQAASTSLDSLQWQRLTGASAIPPNRVLVDAAQMAHLVAALPHLNQLAFRLTVLSATDQPVQQCEIAVSLEK